MAKKQSSFWIKLIEWQNYVHYILLALWVFIWHTVSYNETVEQIFITAPISGFFILILWWALGLFIGDTIIHWLFWVAPKLIRWRD